MSVGDVGTTDVIFSDLSTWDFQVAQSFFFVERPRQIVILSRTPLPPHPQATMSAFLAGSPVVAKVTATPVTKRDVTVRAAANAEYVFSHEPTSALSTFSESPPKTSDAIQGTSLFPLPD